MNRGSGKYRLPLPKEAGNYESRDGEAKEIGGFGSGIAILDWGDVSDLDSGGKLANLADFD